MRRCRVWSLVLVLAFLALAGAACADQYGGTRVSIAPLVVNGVLVPDQITSAGTVTLVGAVTSNVGLKALYWRNNRGGKGRPHLYVGNYGEMEMNGKWRIPRISLKYGRNEIKVTAVPVQGQSISKVTVIYRQK